MLKRGRNRGFYAICCPMEAFRIFSNPGKYGAFDCTAHSCTGKPFRQPFSFRLPYATETIGVALSGEASCISMGW